LGSIEEYESSYLGLTVDLFTSDTDAAREQVEKALVGVAHKLTVEYEVVP
jgi:hypothetical protein